VRSATRTAAEDFFFSAPPVCEYSFSSTRGHGLIPLFPVELLNRPCNLLANPFVFVLRNAPDQRGVSFSSFLCLRACNGLQREISDSFGDARCAPRPNFLVPHAVFFSPPFLPFSLDGPSREKYTASGAIAPLRSRQIFSVCRFEMVSSLNESLP